jgi:hypothetical protein
MKRLLPLIALLLILATGRTHAQASMGIDLKSVFVSTDTSHLHVNDSLILSFTVKNTGKDSFTGGYVNVGLRILNSKYPAGYNPPTIAFQRPVGSVFRAGSITSFFISMQLADSLFKSGINELQFYAYGYGTSSAPASDSFVMNLHLSPALAHPVAIDKSSLNFSSDTSALKQNGTVNFTLNLHSFYPNLFYYGASAHVMVLNSGGPSIFSKTFGSVSAYMGYDSVAKMSVSLPLPDTAFKLGNNVVVVWPESNITNFQPDTIRFNLTVLNPVPLKIDPNSISFGHDTASLFDKDSFSMAYKVLNQSGKSFNSLALNTHLRVINSNGTHDTANIGSGFSGGLPYLQSAPLSFSIPLSDPIFSLGSNVVVIWPESNTTMNPDTLRLKLTVLNSGIALVIDSNSISFDKDTSGLGQSDSVTLYYNVRNHYGKKLSLLLNTGAKVINSAGQSPYTSPVTSPISVTLPFESSVKLSFTVVFSDSIFHPGNNVIVVWPESSTALKPDTARINFYIQNTGIKNSLQTLTGVRLYPNPSSGSIHFMAETGQPRLQYYRVTDLSGRVVEAGFISNNFIDISSLKSGAYLIHLQNTKNEEGTFVFVKD